MAATATERKLLIDGEWVETGDWVDVRSPYSGEVVGRVAKAGAAEARRAVDAAARALENPLPAHKRAEILVKVAGLIGRRLEEVARTICEEAGKPIKTARVEASRAMSTYTFAAVEARKLAGEMIPMESAQAGEGKLGFTLRRPIGIVGAISPFNFPLQPRRAQARARARRRLPRRAQACERDAALGAPARRARAGGRTARRLAQRPRRPGVGDRRRARGGRPGQADHVHRLRRGRLGPPAARGAQAREARARQLDAGDRRRRRRPRRRRRQARRRRVRLRRPDVHLRAADLRRARGLRRVPAGIPAEGRGAEGRRPRRRRHRRRAGDRRGLAHADPRLDRRGASLRGEAARRRRGRRADPADRARRGPGRGQGELRRGLRPGRDRQPASTRSTRRSTVRTGRGSACRRASSPPRSTRRCARPTRSSSAASSSTRCRPTAPTRCRTAA